VLGQRRYAFDEEKAMSERLEQWKVRERIRTDVGWVAVMIGLWGLLPIAGSLASIVWPETVNTRVLSILGGLALICCAVGLWNTKSWARWITVVLFGLLSIGGILNGQICWLPWTVFPVVYLLLPSTGRRFASVKGYVTPELRRN